MPVAPPAAGEAALVERAQADPRAFGPLYDAYVAAVYRYCYRRLHDHHEAEDATAHTFRRALEALPAYRWTGAPFGAWLFRIAANHLADRSRPRPVTVPLDPANNEAGGYQASEEPAPLDALLANEEAHELWVAVAALPMAQRRVLVLRFGQELTNQQTARILNRSETATKQLVYRALQALRAAYRAREETG